MKSFKKIMESSSHYRNAIGGIVKNITITLVAHVMICDLQRSQLVPLFIICLVIPFGD